MRIPYGYVLSEGQLTINEKTADTVHKIFNYYLAGASLEKIADRLFVSGIPSPTGNPKWTRAAIDKLLSNAKYIPLVGFELYSDIQFEKERRCNIDYDRAGHPRKATRFQSTIELLHSFQKYPPLLYYILVMSRRRIKMTGDELREKYLLFGFSFETTVNCLLSRNLFLEDMVPNARKQFYDSLNEEKIRELKVLLSYQESICRYMRETDPNNDMVSLTEIARQHSNEAPGYMIQS